MNSSLDEGPVDAGFWPALADRVMRWLDAQGAPARDAVLLLPHAGLLAPARVAFARRGGWQPRIETALTLAQSLAPPPPGGEWSLSGDHGSDALTAAALLRRHGWQAPGRDPRLVDEAVAALLQTARALQRASAAQPPDARALWWDGMRDALPPVQGPGATERLLARVALEWAAASAAPATDCLWPLRPSAWIALRVAGHDASISHLLDAAPGPVLRLDADPPLQAPFDAAARLPGPRCVRAQGLEDEAGAAALAVLHAIDRGLAPVALIAQDRLVVRRIRALLDRAQVAIADETGWTLDTTRAGAAAMALLRAASPTAGRDALIEAMKSDAPDEASALEDAWRRERPVPPFAAAAEQAFRERLQPLRSPGRRPLTAWLDAMRAASPRLIDALAADAAGRPLLTALHLDGPGDAAWRAIAGASVLDLAGFTAWVDGALEAATFSPPAAPDPQVIVTPLARAALRPFGAVVFPGCDERHLGAWRASPTLLPEAVARRFGVPEAASLRERETIAFAQVLRVPELTLLRREQDADEALAPSPLLERARLARVRAGQPPAEEQAFAAPLSRIARTALSRPAPPMADRLPQRLSASATEALRDCPYRFFARSALGLREIDELDAALDKSDFGRWVHAVLYRFHAQRESAENVASDRQRLLAAADDVQAELGLDAAQLLPFRAGFDQFADHYLEWLHARDAAGWRWAGGELERRCAPPELGGVVLEGRLDRIDIAPDGAAMLIDYKTVNADKLRQRVRAPLEDTQLAFYAALLTEEAPEPPPRAIYLALDERGKPQAIEHDDVSRSAALLVEGLAEDLDALRRGAGAAALGEGDACRFCAARGLCRRDHWT